MEPCFITVPILIGKDLEDNDYDDGHTKEISAAIYKNIISPLQALELVQNDLDRMVRIRMRLNCRTNEVSFTSYQLAFYNPRNSSLTQFQRVGCHHINNQPKKFINHSIKKSSILYQIYFFRKGFDNNDWAFHSRLRRQHFITYITFRLTLLCYDMVEAMSIIITRSLQNIPN